MVSTYKHNKITWYDIENPTQDEVRKLSDQYAIDPQIANELFSPSRRSRIEYNYNFIYLILKFPDINENWRESKDLTEIDFIIGKDFIITTRYKNIEALHEFTKIFEVENILNKNKKMENSGILFFNMIKSLYRSLTDKLEYTQNILSDFEEKIFAGQEKEAVYQLAKLQRFFFRFRESTNEHKDVLNYLELITQDFFGKDYLIYTKGILLEYQKVLDITESKYFYLKELKRTNDSLLSTKQNETMKTLTVMAFMVLPISLLASIFGMNAKNMPFIGLPNDFTLIIFIMIITNLILYVYFKIKKWI